MEEKSIFVWKSHKVVWQATVFAHLAQRVGTACPAQWLVCSYCVQYLYINAQSSVNCDSSFHPVLSGCGLFITVHVAFRSKMETHFTYTLE